MSGKAFQAVLTVGLDLENCERKKCVNRASEKEGKKENRRKEKEKKRKGKGKKKGKNSTGKRKRNQKKLKDESLTLTYQVSMRALDL